MKFINKWWKVLLCINLGVMFVLIYMCPLMMDWRHSLFLGLFIYLQSHLNVLCLVWQMHKKKADAKTQDNIHVIDDDDEDEE